MTWALMENSLNRTIFITDKNSRFFFFMFEIVSKRKKKQPFFWNIFFFLEKKKKLVIEHLTADQEVLSSNLGAQINLEIRCTWIQIIYFMPNQDFSR